MAAEHYLESAEFVDTKSFQIDDDGNIFFETSDASTTTTVDSNQQNQDVLMDQLLQELNLTQVKPFLMRAAIDYESLRYLSKDDIKEAIPPIGLRAQFREKLFIWKRTKYGIHDEVLPASIGKKIATHLPEQNSFATISMPVSRPTTSRAVASGKSPLSKELKLLLQDSLRGKAITDFYRKSGHLIDSLRADLMYIILEDIFYNDLKLSPKDFLPIMQELLENFPNEIKEYYYNARGKNRNPTGKLWDKYVNQRRKRKLITEKLTETFDAKDPIAQIITNIEIDVPVLLPLKDSLSRDFSNWDEVREKWQRTFLLRQKELKSSETIYEFLNDWPLYTHRRAHELIHIDFELLYPNKGNLLLYKWNEFNQKIGGYYSVHIKDKNCREVFVNSRSINDRCSIDYIHAFLLNAVIIPTARFSHETAKQVKISIADANESFILHLCTMSGYESVLLELRQRFYHRDLTVQPLIIVVGSSIYNLEEFYVYFEKTLFKFDKFLTCLDVCFKIIQTLSLSYPKSCYGPWLFIQEYFYEISLASDSKLSSICSLLNFLKTQ